MPTKARREYVGGYQEKGGALRKHSYKILNGPLEGKVFFSETWTPKNRSGEWGEPKTKYYWADDEKMHPNVEQLLKAKS